MEPGQPVTGFGEGNGTNGSDAKSSLSTDGLSSFEIILLEPRFSSDVRLPISHKAHPNQSSPSQLAQQQ
ncbi:hypothetical protein COLO4_35104 [Corchorus olitorius]|uniref:Uncharacterized protein n=1 Tax=Corchorus olitorius TaxID=93759 RepID=A0A1R3GI49_9ROSI|nr:hypothetical protein COLO4_35104 [Corchorus olitorius]